MKWIIGLIVAYGYCHILLYTIEKLPNVPQIKIYQILTAIFVVGLLAVIAARE